MLGRCLRGASQCPTTVSARQGSRRDGCAAVRADRRVERPPESTCAFRRHDLLVRRRQGPHPRTTRARTGHSPSTPARPGQQPALVVAILIGADRPDECPKRKRRLRVLRSPCRTVPAQDLAGDVDPRPIGPLGRRRHRRAPFDPVWQSAPLAEGADEGPVPRLRNRVVVVGVVDPLIVCPAAPRVVVGLLASEEPLDPGSNRGRWVHDLVLRDVERHVRPDDQHDHPSRVGVTVAQQPARPNIGDLDPIPGGVVGCQFARHVPPVALDERPRQVEGVPSAQAYAAPSLGR